MQNGTCGRCGKSFIRPERQRGPLERFWSLLSVYPFRCQLCTHRFFRFRWNRRHTKSWANNDRRRYDRLNVNFPLTVMLDIARTLDGEALDLTVRGCAVQSTKRLPEGLLVGLRLRPSPHEPPIEIAWAVVQTILPQGFGLYFASIDPADEERLRSHVESLFVATAAAA